MDRLSSADFRKRYASLTRDTLVTVNGHVIGQWTPIGRPDEVFSNGPGEPVDVIRNPDRFNSRPFTPVPKKSR
jgi:hypothetical protein